MNNRDLKPENLLLDSKGLDARLKVIDFGTSKRFHTGTKMTQKFGTVILIINRELMPSLGVLYRSRSLRKVL